jgi:hypothetical protein
MDILPPLIAVNGGIMTPLYLQPFSASPQAATGRTDDIYDRISVPSVSQRGTLGVAVLVSSLLYLGCGYGYRLIDWLYLRVASLNITVFLDLAGLRKWCQMPLPVTGGISSSDFYFIEQKSAKLELCTHLQLTDQSNTTNGFFFFNITISRRAVDAQSTFQPRMDAYWQ